MIHCKGIFVLCVEQKKFTCVRLCWYKWHSLYKIENLRENSVAGQFRRKMQGIYMYSNDVLGKQELNLDPETPVWLLITHFTIFQSLQHFLSNSQIFDLWMCWKNCFSLNLCKLLRYGLNAYVKLSSRTFFSWIPRRQNSAKNDCWILTSCHMDRSVALIPVCDWALEKNLDILPVILIYVVTIPTCQASENIVWVRSNHYIA